jgi:hypothetical protein
MITINDVRNFFGKRMTTMMVILAVVMLLSMGAYFGRTALGGGEATERVVAVVDGKDITESELTKSCQAQEEVAREGGQRLTPETALSAHAGAIYSVVLRTILDAEVESRGIRVDEQTVIENLTKDYQKQLETERQRLINDQMLDPNASDEEFKEVLRRDTGANWDKELQTQIAEVRELMQREETRDSLLNDARLAALHDQISSSVKLTEADYKKAKERIRLRRVLVKGASHQNARERIDAAMAEIRSGVPFEDVVEKYSDEAVGGFEGHEVPKGEITLQRESLQQNPVLGNLADKGPGFVSEIKPLADDFGIYKVMEVLPPTLPTDYEKRKDAYLEEFRRAQGDQVYQQWFLQRMTKAKVEFRSKPWEVVYRYIAREYETRMSAVRPGTEEQAKQLFALMKEADAARKAGGKDASEALLVEFSLARRLLNDLDVKDLKMREEAEAVQNEYIDDVLRLYSDPTLRMEFVNLCIRKEDYKQAVRQLRRLGTDAFSYTDQEHQTIHWQIKLGIDLIASRGYQSEEFDKLIDTEEVWRAKASEIMREMPAVPPGAAPGATSPGLPSPGTGGAAGGGVPR